ncbi:hypothetical protein FB45DRAFT_298343 [Roridomyces roridus]|uniref:F-box domain-containing protein n=1 Tax=Roridomyces roridus TaxID=1738132 RepID=A0AAD7FYH9_9AGAR|nr:hypothetical protein FB45DRAFT_298343 [Roridomyces roridus]
MESILSNLMLGDPCSATFARQVKDYISAAEAKIARFDTQIQDLTRLRDQERELISALTPLIAPIRKLPVELLTEIFLLAVDSTTEDWLTHALLVSQVCAHWRRVACATPQLWNGEIPLDLTKERSDVCLATTKTVFERSAPLSIPILLYDELAEASPLAEYIYSLAPRWKSLCWAGSSSRLLALPAGALGSLEKVDLGTTDLPSSSPIDVFLGAQRLNNVCSYIQSTTFFRMPWWQVITLSLMEDGGPTPAQRFLDILLQCSSVVDVFFSRMMPWGEAPASSASIIPLPRLQNLTLIFGPHPDQNITPFFTRLALPALTSLTIHSSTGTSWSSADFTQFQRRSPKVQALALEAARLTTESALALLTEYRHLTDIDLQFCFRRSEPLDLSSVLNWLRYKDIASPVPQLRRLSIVDRWIDRLDEAICEGMILSRWWTDPQLVPQNRARLESLTISGSRSKLSAPFLAKMEQLRAEGLEVTLK